MDRFKVLPKDVEGMSGLLGHQEDHYGELASYASSTCGITTGMTNVMALLAPKVEELAGWCAWKLRTCGSMMNTTVVSLKKTQELYEKKDQQAKDELLHLFSDPMAGIHYPELTNKDIPFLNGSYHDKWSQPPNPSGVDPGMDKLIEDRKGGLINDCEDIWALSDPDRTLVAQLITPIVGDYSQLYWLKEAYDALGNGTYSVAENLRRGTIEIGENWDGPAATNFEYHMFEWHQGTGGLGDLFELASEAYEWVYDQVMHAVNKILDKIQELVYKNFPPIQEVLDRNPGSYDKIRCAPRTSEGVRIVPDDTMPKDDLNLYMKRMHEAAKFVNQIKKDIQELEKLYEEGKKKIGEIWTMMGQASKDPVAYVADTIHTKMQDRLVNFERPEGEKFDKNKWNPTQGVWRVELLPGY